MEQQEKLLVVLGLILVSFLAIFGGVYVSQNETIIKESSSPSPFFALPSTPKPTILSGPYYASPTPVPSFEISNADFKKEDILSILLESTVDNWQDKRLARWETRPVVAARGSPTNQDTMCVNQASGLLNSLMGEKGSVLSFDNTGTFEVYFIPQASFVSMYPDVEPSKVATLIPLKADSSHALIGQKALIDSGLPQEARCKFAKEMLFLGMGLWRVDKIPLAKAGNNFISSETSPAATEMGPVDKEVIKMLYSPNLISGLTAEEITKRIR